MNKAEKNEKQNAEPAWFDPSLKSQNEFESSSLNAPRFGYLLADLPKQYITPEILKIRERTKSGFAKQKYRSTIDNAKLVKLFTADKEALEDKKINIDGKDFELKKDRILPLSKDQLKPGGLSAVDRWAPSLRHGEGGAAVRNGRLSSGVDDAVGERGGEVARLERRPR